MATEVMKFTGLLGSVNIARKGEGLSSFQINFPDRPRGEDTAIISCSNDLAIEAAKASGAKVTVSISTEGE